MRTWDGGALRGGRRDRSTHGGEVLRRPEVRLLLASITLTAAGRWIFNVGIAALVFEATRSAGWLAALTVGRYLPALLLGPVVAVAVRRWPARRTVVGGDLLACTVTALVVGAALVEAPVGAVILMVSAASLLTRTRTPVTSAFLLELVDEGELARAGAALRSTESAALVIGPLLGGLLVAVGNATLAMGAAGGLYAVSAVTIAVLPEPGRPRTDVTGGAYRGALLGLRAVLSRRSRPYALVAALSSFGFGVDTVLLVVLAHTRLGSGSSGFGLLLAALGVGGLLGALAVDRLCRTSRLGLLAAGALLLYALPLLAFLVVRDPWIALLVMVPRGAGAVMAESVALTAVQRSTRAVGVSRVLVGFHALLLATLVLGAAVAPLAQRLGGPPGLLALGGAVLPVLALALAPVLARRDREGRAHAQELGEKVAVLDGLAIFDGARRVTLERLAAGLRTQELSAGDVLLRQGEPARSFYVLVSGTVDVLVDDGRLVRTLDAPAHLGEIGLLHRIPRTATVVAHGPVSVLRADGDEFLAALSDAPISPALEGSVVARLGATSPVSAAGPTR